MNKQNKQLLLKALCGYIPYRVQALAENVFSKPEDVEIEAVTCFQEVKLNWYNFTVDIQDLKPYLRPLSSMTEDEHKELARKGIYVDDDFDICYDMYDDRNVSLKYVVSEYIDWLNEHHFDYRGLIEKGLALPAPDGMY